MLAGNSACCTNWHGVLHRLTRRVTLNDTSFTDSLALRSSCKRLRDCKVVDYCIWFYTKEQMQSKRILLRSSCVTSSHPGQQKSREEPGGLFDEKSCGLLTTVTAKRKSFQFIYLF